VIVFDPFQGDISALNRKKSPAGTRTGYVPNIS
jgi:hypothetical protein